MHNQQTLSSLWTAVYVAGSGVLTVFAIIQTRFFELFYDYYFGIITPGIILLGCSLAAAHYHFSCIRAQVHEKPQIAWLICTVPTALASQLLFLHLPLNSIYAFFLINLFLILLFYFWSSGIYRYVSQKNSSTNKIYLACLTGAIIGVVSESWLTDITGSYFHLSYMLIAALSLLLIIPSRNKWQLTTTITATLACVFCVYQITQTSHQLPNWTTGNQFKPILGTMASSKSMQSVANHQDSAARYDLATLSNNQTADMGWVLTNGTSPVAVKLSNNGNPYEWLKSRFPILTVPFTSILPDRILSIENAPGPDTSIAVATGVKDIDVISTQLAPPWSSESRPVLRQSASIPSSDGIRLLNVTARKFRPPDNVKYDIIFLPITHPGSDGWIGSNAGESLLYTVEALNSYFNMLGTSGMLAITTRENLLYGRALLTAWKLLIDKYGPATKPEDFLVGARLSSISPFKGSYQNLLLVSKGPVSSTTAAYIRNSVRDLPVELLFGAGIKPVRPFGIIYHPDGLQGAEVSLSQFHNNRIRKRTDIVSTTDSRPYFFQVLHDLHPFLKWLFTALLATIILILLLPLSRSRITNASDANITAPIPLMLGYLALPALGIGMLLTGISQQRHNLPLIPITALYIAIVPILIGFYLSLMVTLKYYSLRITSWLSLSPLFSALFVGTTGWMLSQINYTSGGWASTFWIILTPLIFFASGFSIGMQVAHGIKLIYKSMIRLVPWAWLIFGLAAFSGTILGHWVSQLHGQIVMWAALVICYLSSYGIGLWAWHDNNPGPVTALP